MIKLVFCLRRLPTLSREAFQRHWAETHAPLVRAAAATLGIRRYVQSHSIFVPQLQANLDARGILSSPFDGVAELWFDSLDHMSLAGSTKEGREAGRSLRADERLFIDLPNSPLFLSREAEIDLGYRDA